MKKAAFSGAALAIILGTSAAHASGGGGGGPVPTICYDEDTGEEIECPAATPTPTPAPTPTPSGGGGGSTPTPTPTPAVSSSYTIGFNTLNNNQALGTYTEGDYIVKLVAGSIAGGFGAYGTRGLDTLGPLAQLYVAGSPTPQFSIQRADGGLFTLDSFFSVRLSGEGTNSVTLQGYNGATLGNSSTIVSNFDGFGNPQPSLLTGSYDKVVFSLSTTSSGMSIDMVTATAVAAVPEPATWGMMILGFGMVGGTMRYRRRSAKVSFA